MKRKAVQIVLSLTLTAAMCFGAPAMAFAGETTAKEESTDKTEAKDSTAEKEEAKETAENTDGGEFINAGSGDWEYDYTEDENGNVIDTGNNDFLREQLKELQADLLDMSDKELVECRSLLLERINWCMTAILES